MVTSSSRHSSRWLPAGAQAAVSLRRGRGLDQGEPGQGDPHPEAQAGRAESDLDAGILKPAAGRPGRHGQRTAQPGHAKGAINPHRFRHGFAREFLKYGGNLASLAGIMGHSDISFTWQAYAVFTVDELKAAHARYSPVAQLALRVGRIGVADPDLTS